MRTVIRCCSAYAKLGMISSALSSDSDDVTKLLNVSLDLITASNTPNAASDKAKGGQTGLGTKLPPIPTPKTGTRADGLKGGAAVADSERAVEVLSFLVSKTKVRRVCMQQAVPMKRLDRVSEAAVCTPSSSDREAMWRVSVLDEHPSSIHPKPGRQGRKKRWIRLSPISLPKCSGACRPCAKIREFSKQTLRDAKCEGLAATYVCYVTIAQVQHDEWTDERLPFPVSWNNCRSDRPYYRVATPRLASKCTSYHVVNCSSRLSIPCVCRTIAILVALV